MHGTFAFLMDLDEECLEDKATATTQTRNMFEEYARHNLDENNRWHLIGLLLRDGRLFLLGNEGGRLDALNDAPPEERWAWAERWALRSVATEMGLSEAVLNGPSADLTTAIEEQIPATLSTMFEQSIGSKPVGLRGEPRSEWLAEDRRRRGLATRYEAYLHSTFPPFTELSPLSPTPYDQYPAIDLSGVGDQPMPETAAILFVDIHC